MGLPRARLALVPMVVLVAACGSDDPASDGPPTNGADPVLEGTLTVLGASSLTAAFEDVATAFEDQYPSVEVDLSFDGSANLATAIIEGGVEADVFASADEANLQNVADEGFVEGDGTTFVTNLLQIVVAEGNPLGIDGLEDLAGTEVALSLCKEEAPCGKYAWQAFEAAGLPVPPAGVEDKVTGVLTRVTLGEADAGLVYVTDVLAAEGVSGIDLAKDEQVLATYPAAVLTDAPNPEAAAAFIAFLSGDEAQAILEGYGFGLP